MHTKNKLIKNILFWLHIYILNQIRNQNPFMQSGNLFIGSGVMELLTFVIYKG